MSNLFKPPQADRQEDIEILFNPLLKITEKIFHIVMAVPEFE